jgi:hypothetical protein
MELLKTKEKKEKKDKGLSHSTGSVSSPRARPKPKNIPSFTPAEKQEIVKTIRGFKHQDSRLVLKKNLEECGDEVSSLVEILTELDKDTESDSGNTSYDTGTFCVKTLASDDSEGYDSGTFCLKDLHDSSSGSNGSLTGGNRNPESQSAPDFKHMFREPEEWEKHILAFEKGEWVEGMGNGAFNRWKPKNRKPVPSAYMKASPLISESS